MSHGSNFSDWNMSNNSETFRGGLLPAILNVTNTGGGSPPLNDARMNDTLTSFEACP